MPKTFEKSSLLTNKHNPKNNHEPYNSKSYLPPNRQSLKQKFLSKKGF